MDNKQRTRVDVSKEAHRVATAAAALQGVTIKELATTAILNFGRRVIKVYVQDESGEA